MATSRERQFWIEFFELYRRKQELWKVKSEDYKDRSKKILAYNALIRKCKEVEPKADKEFVTRKISSFRSVYKRELKKVNKSLRAGNEYVPSLWYYKYLSFLKDQEESNINEEGNENDSQNEHEEGEKEKTAIPKNKKIKKTTINSDELLELAAKRLKKNDDYSQTLANVWAREFRIASEHQQLFAKKAIDDILFEARMGTLHRNSVKINHPELFNPEQNEIDCSPFNHTKRNSTQSLKREPYNKNYLDMNEMYPEGSPSSQHDSITIEHVSEDTLL